MLCEESGPAPINSRLSVVMRSPTPFGLSRNGCWPSRGFHLPRALFWNHLLPSYPLNDRRRAAHNFSEIGRLSSPFFCLLHTHLRLFILLLLISGNVHPNPGLIFLCSVCIRNVIWWDKSVQCCTCSKWVHPRCSLLTLSKFRTLGISHP